MPTILADHDVEGHLRVLLNLWLTPTWIDIWSDLSCNVETFERLGIEDNTPDSDIWQLCQRHEIVLIPGNRNAEGEQSLEATIRRLNKPQSLPVFTIGDPDRLMRDRTYAEDVAAQLLDYLQEVDDMRGAGRLYLP